MAKIKDKPWYKQISFSEYMSVVAVVLSITIPIAFRQCDKMDAEPKVSMELTHRAQISERDSPDIISAITDATGSLHHMQRVLESISENFPRRFANDFVKMHRFEKFELILRNHRSKPVSISNLKGELLNSIPPISDTNVAVPLFYTSEMNSDKWMLNQPIRLDELETKSIRLIIAFDIRCGDSTIQHLFAKSRESLQSKGLGSPTNVSDFIGLGAPKKDNSMEPFAMLDVYENYLSEIKLGKIRISAFDPFGRIFSSNYTDIKPLFEQVGPID